MKAVLFFAGLVALASTAPQPRKLFHEHFQDFTQIIMSELGDYTTQLFEEYLQYEEFRQALDFMSTRDFKDLIAEMEDLPEFKAVVDFLEKDNIDILYFLDSLNEVIPADKLRQAASGKDFTSFMNDVISAFPKDKLLALFEQKQAEDEEFRTAIQNLESEEWTQIYSALLASETFQKEIQTLAENGIDFNVFITEIKAIFGQN